MEAYEANTHSFIVKLWIEEFRPEPEPPLWRGRITHVPDGQHRYFANLEDLLRFLVTYLHEMGVKRL